MFDPRHTQLAKLLVEYSLALQANDRVLLDITDTPDDFTIELIRAIREVEAIPIVENRHSRVSREIIFGTNQTHATIVRDIELSRLKQMQAYIAIRGAANASEFSDVPGKLMTMFAKTVRPVQNYRVNKTRWCVLRWPTPSMAQVANMSTEAFEDFFFKVCTLDYSKMARAMVPLQKRLLRADKVKILSPGTDLRFSIKGMPALRADGKSNIPDGEVFTCPVKESVEGVIEYNTPSIYDGARFERVRLEFERGRIVDARSNDTKRLNEILDRDAGARYIGEFALGLNPYILNPMCDILFDEKIAGSLHFTPGQAYEDADNGNRSAVHWDLVLIQRPEWGGGEIWLDGDLIRKDGLFVPTNLKPLNPENFEVEGKRRPKIR